MKFVRAVKKEREEEEERAKEHGGWRKGVELGHRALQATGTETGESKEYISDSDLTNRPTRRNPAPQPTRTTRPTTLDNTIIHLAPGDSIISRVVHDFQRESLRNPDITPFANASQAQNFRYAACVRGPNTETENVVKEEVANDGKAGEAPTFVEKAGSKVSHLHHANPPPLQRGSIQPNSASNQHLHSLTFPNPHSELLFSKVTNHRVSDDPQQSTSEESKPDTATTQHLRTLTIPRTALQALVRKVMELGDAGVEQPDPSARFEIQAGDAKDEVSGTSHVDEDGDREAIDEKEIMEAHLVFAIAVGKRVKGGSRWGWYAGWLPGRSAGGISRLRMEREGKCTLLAVEEFRSLLG